MYHFYLSVCKVVVCKWLIEFFAKLCYEFRSSSYIDVFFIINFDQPKISIEFTYL